MRAENTEQIAAALYRMNGRAWYGHDLGDWDDPTSRIGRNEAERERWCTQARTLGSLNSARPAWWSEGMPEPSARDLRRDVIARALFTDTQWQWDHARPEILQRYYGQADAVMAAEDAFAWRLGNAGE